MCSHKRCVQRHLLSFWRSNSTVSTLPLPPQAVSPSVVHCSEDRFSFIEKIFFFVVVSDLSRSWITVTSTTRMSAKTISMIERSDESFPHEDIGFSFAEHSLFRIIERSFSIVELSSSRHWSATEIDLFQMRFLSSLDRLVHRWALMSHRFFFFLSISSSSATITRNSSTSSVFQWNCSCVWNNPRSSPKLEGESAPNCLLLHLILWSVKKNPSSSVHPSPHSVWATSVEMGFRNYFRHWRQGGKRDDRGRLMVQRICPTLRRREFLPLSNRIVDQCRRVETNLLDHPFDDNRMSHLQFQSNCRQMSKHWEVLSMVQTNFISRSNLANFRWLSISIRYIRCAPRCSFHLMKWFSLSPFSAIVSPWFLFSSISGQFSSLDLRRSK